MIDFCQDHFFDDALNSWVLLKIGSGLMLPSASFHAVDLHDLNLDERKRVIVVLKQVGWVQTKVAHLLREGSVQLFGIS